MFDFEGKSAREVSLPDIHWCYMLPFLQLLHLLQVCSVQQVKTEQHFGLFDDNRQSLFCEGIIAKLFLKYCLLFCTRLVNSSPSCFMSLPYTKIEVTWKRSKTSFSLCVEE